MGFDKEKPMGWVFWSRRHLAGKHRKARRHSPDGRGLCLGARWIMNRSPCRIF